MPHGAPVYIPPKSRNIDIVKQAASRSKVSQNSEFQIPKL